MVFSLPTRRLILEDMNERDLASVGRIACDPGIMKYVLIWLENEEQVAGFVRHAIEEAARRDRQGYILAVRIPGTGDFAGFVLLEIDPTQPTTAEIGCILRPEVLEERVRLGDPPGAARVRIRTAWPPPGVREV